MKIDTDDTKPIKMRPYGTPLKNREVFDKALEEMLEAKVLRSNSPWSFLQTETNYLGFVIDENGI